MKRHRTLTENLAPPIWLKVAIAFGCAFSAGGCAVHYYSPTTGVEHVFGFGHMKMKGVQPNEGIQSVVHGTDVAGLSLGRANKHSYLTLGWHRVEFVEVVAQDSKVRLERPAGGFVNMRVGSEFPLDSVGAVASRTAKNPMEK